MHKEVDRIYELNEYLRFHTRSFKKLTKLKTEVKKDEQQEPVWDQMDDAVDDLDQYGYYLDSLKERFNNLIELEFNIENANQCKTTRKYFKPRTNADNVLQRITPVSFLS